MDENHFDVIILGTGLTESILAAALSKAGFKVAHVDINRYYGSCEASLSLDELAQWAHDAASTDSLQSRYTHITHSMHSDLSQSRYYSISLCPSVIPSMGPIISSLVSSGVSKYGSFRLVDTVAIYDAASGTVKSVPGSKEDVFKSKEISLIDKRRIMRFLTFAISDFEDKQELEGKQETPFLDFLKSVFAINDNVSLAIAYALAYCTSPTEKTLPALNRLRHYLRSAGRYGPSPFLVGHYGGTGEIAQGFCRAAAVSGAIYILGRRIQSILSPTPTTDLYTVNLEDMPEPLSCKLLISSPSMVDYLPSRVSKNAEESSQPLTIARGIAIVDYPITFTPAARASENVSEPRPAEGEDKIIDTGIIVFPPFALPGGSTSASGLVFITGEGSMSAPRGKSIIYLALPISSGEEISPEALLKPYLEATISLAADNSNSGREPLLTTFYLEHIYRTSIPDADQSCLMTPPVNSERLPEAPDMAATNAEEVFWKAIRLLRTNSDDQEGKGMVEDFWPPTSQEDEVDEE
ncbi:FAD/NAD-P-binding domain containing protein [Amanita muscaria]